MLAATEFDNYLGVWDLLEQISYLEEEIVAVFETPYQVCLLVSQCGYVMMKSLRHHVTVSTTSMPLYMTRYDKPECQAPHIMILYISSMEMPSLCRSTC